MFCQWFGLSSEPVTLKVTYPSFGNSFRVSFRFPVPLALPQTAPPAPLHAHVQTVPTAAAGKLSVTTTPVTASGPVFPTVMVKVKVFESVAKAVRCAVGSCTSV